MIRQHNPGRYTTLTAGRKIGTIPIGTIVYIQDRVDRWNPPRRRTPWIVEAWIPRDCMGRKMAGGHLAVVRSLRDRRNVATVADHLLAWSLEVTEG